MDNFDQHILTLLQRDASISLKDLAEAVQQAQGSLDLYERRGNVWLFGGLALVALISAVAITAQALGLSIADILETESWQAVLTYLADGGALTLDDALGDSYSPVYYGSLLGVPNGTAEVGREDPVSCDKVA